MSFSNRTIEKLEIEKKAEPGGTFGGVTGSGSLGIVLMVMKRVSPLGVPPITSAFCLLTVPAGPTTRAVIWLLVVVAGGVPTRGSGQLSPRPVEMMLLLTHNPPAASAFEQ